MELQAAEFYRALLEPVFQGLLNNHPVVGIVLISPDGRPWMSLGVRDCLDPGQWENYTAYSLDQGDFILLPPASVEAPQLYCWSWCEGALFIVWEAYASVAPIVREGQAVVQEMRRWMHPRDS